MDTQQLPEAMSESVEMYLLRVALLQEDDRPVPISALAEEMTVSPVSANQMCRKLEERGLVHYEPYKGVTLTLNGEALAMRVLRKRRLWEVLLADKLGLDPAQAEDIACRFEHVTPDWLGERLADFLGNPTYSPQQEPIPPSIGVAVRRPRLMLAALGLNQPAQVGRVLAEDATREFLRSHGLQPGASVRVLALADAGALLVESNGDRLMIGAELAQQIEVITARAVKP
ncbi:MAG: metal-dependent transcriptional regulator [Caldilineales bacterium]